MQTTVQARSRRHVPRSTAADKRFGRYKPEREKAVRAPEVKEDRVLQQLRGAWGRFEYSGYTSPVRNYPRAQKALKGLRYTPKDVERFSLVLAEF